MRTTRRDLLRSAALISATGAAPAFLDRTARAAVPDKDGQILILIQLAGGNDGLNTVVPFTDDAYYRLRSTLAVPAGQLLKLDERLGLHPELAGVRSLVEAGRCAIVQGVGYPNPDRSHFRSMDIWESASGAEKTLSTGWVGRLFDARCPGCEHPASGIAVGSTLPVTFKGRSGIGVAVEDPEQFRRLVAGRTESQSSPAGNGQIGALDFLRRTAASARASAELVAEAAGKGRAEGEYPQGQFGQSLRLISRMISGGLPARFYFASLGGFDTHANQVPAHPNLLRQFSQGIAALVSDLEKQGNLERTLILQFSEFGRRVAQNGSGGTDHGTAAPLFLFGSRVRPGVHGSLPDLADLDRGDLKHAIDFRRVYAAVIRDWIGMDPEPILGPGFQPLDVIRPT